MKLLNAGSVSFVRGERDVEILEGSLAGRMTLFIVLGWTEVDSSGVARAFAGIWGRRGILIRSRLILSGSRLVRRILRPRKSPEQRQNKNQKSNAHLFIVSLLFRFGAIPAGSLCFLFREFVIPSDWRPQPAALAGWGGERGICS